MLRHRTQMVRDEKAAGQKVLSMKDLLQSDYCAGMLRVLADPERLLIIQSLREAPKTVSQIGATQRRQCVMSPIISRSCARPGSSNPNVKEGSCAIDWPRGC